MIRFNKFLSLLKANLPSFNVKFKNNSTLMKIIGYLLFFNKSFMTSFTTTIGPTVYFPTEKHLENELSSMKTLAHEYVHAKDAKKFSSTIFSLLYLLPQILAPLMLFFMFIHWALGLSLFLLFLAPLPAPGRAYFELRGYTMSLFMLNEVYKERGLTKDTRLPLLNKSAVNYNKQFTSANYYFMWPFGVKSKLKQAVNDIISEDILKKDSIYNEVAEAFINSSK